MVGMMFRLNLQSSRTEDGDRDGSVLARSCLCFRLVPCYRCSFEELIVIAVVEFVYVWKAGLD